MNTFTVTSTDGIELTVYETPGKDPGVLTAHATGFNGLTWRRFDTELRRFTGARVLSPDLRGHGASALGPQADLDWGGFADDVTAVAEKMNGAPVGVGHSMGGAALLLAEARRPGTFAAIWCYEPIVIPGAHGRWEDNPLALGALRRRDRFASPREAVANYADKPPMNSFDSTVLESYVEGAFEPTGEGDVRLRCRPEIEAEIFRLGAAHDTAERLGEVACPVIVACGFEEPDSPSQFAAQVAAALPQGRLVRYADLDHFGPMIDPVGMANKVADLVAEAG